MSGRLPRAPRVLSSVLDRLLDDHPDRERDPVSGVGTTASVLRSAVRRDLEHLLNAKKPWRTPPAPALRSSLLGYGLADFTAGALNDDGARDVLRAEIADAIRRFEPRLAKVSVELMDNGSPLQVTLRLRISALLLMEPAPETISFDTTFETSTSDVVVRPAGGP